MNWFTRNFSLSIGKKILMGSTGLFFVLFLIEHVTGNFLLFANDGGVAYNEYSHSLTHNHIIAPIIFLVEILLFSSFILHAIDGTVLYFQNRARRGSVDYIVKRRSQNSMWTSRNMMITGSVILLFLIIHLKTFFVPYRFTNSVPNLYNEVVRVFQSPLYVGFYVFSMVLLALHLQHGFSSAFQTLGMRHPKYFPFLKVFGLLLTIVICGGFAAQPLYFLLFHH
jgi:succinate dehydrogenase / fumarate reductase cytochrome b subunit